MNDYINIIYKDKSVNVFYFMENGTIDEIFFVENNKYKLMASRGEKGACCIVIKNEEHLMFSTIIDTNPVGLPVITLFFSIPEDAYLQVDYVIQSLAEKMFDKNNR